MDTVLYNFPPQSLALTVHKLNLPLKKGAEETAARRRGRISAGQAQGSGPTTPPHQDALPCARDATAAVMVAVARQEAAEDERPATSGEGPPSSGDVVFSGVMQWLCTALFLMMQRVLLRDASLYWWAQLMLLQPLCSGPCASALSCASRSTRTMPVWRAFVSLFVLWALSFAVRTDYWPCIAIPALYLFGCAHAPLYSLAASVDAGLMCLAINCAVGLLFL